MERSHSADECILVSQHSFTDYTQEKTTHKIRLHPRLQLHRTDTNEHAKAPPMSELELRPETWTRLMVAVMRLPVGPDPGILPGSGP